MTPSMVYLKLGAPTQPLLTGLDGRMDTTRRWRCVQGARGPDRNQISKPCCQPAHVRLGANLSPVLDACRARSSMHTAHIGRIGRGRLARVPEGARAEAPEAPRACLILEPWLVRLVVYGVRRNHHHSTPRTIPVASNAFACRDPRRSTGNSRPALPRTKLAGRNGASGWCAHRHPACPGQKRPHG